MADVRARVAPSAVRSTGFRPKEQTRAPTGHARADARTRQTEDLLAVVRRAGLPRVAARVLDLSERGMLLGAEDLTVDEVVSLELQGPGFRFSCRARVAHCTGHATGVRFLSWEGPAGRALGALVAERLDCTDAGIRDEARKRGWGVVAVSARRSPAGP